MEFFQLKLQLKIKTFATNQKFKRQQLFSFVLTQGDGSHCYGYCLRQVPAGSSGFPIAFAIHSSL